MTSIGAIGYAIVGLLYAVLTILLLTTWRGQRVGVFLIIAGASGAVWGFGLAAQTAYGALQPVLIALLEVLRMTAWVAFLVRLVARLGVSPTLRLLALLCCAAVALGIIATGILNARGQSSGAALGSLLIPGGLAIALFGLVLIEQLYRNSSADARWALKPLVFGVGGVFAYDLFLYSQGMMLGAIDSTTWLARGIVNTFFVPMIAIATRRNADWEMRIFVSRQVVFYTTTLVAAGLYLLLMSFGGYLIALYGGSWGGLVQVVFFVGAMLVLVTLLFSNTLRARLKVFLNKHFFHNKYDYREEWLRLVAMLAESDISTRKEAAIKSIAQIVNSPAGAMWIRENGSNLFKLTATYGTTDQFPDFQAQESMIRFVEKKGWLVDLMEFNQYPKRYNELSIPEWLSSRSAPWLFVPLQSEGDLLGVILLYKAPHTPKLNFEDRDLLKTVGNHIAVHLAQARADSRLAEAQQFEAYNRLTAFLMHDLNNLIAQQSLIVSNAEKHRRNPEFVDDAIHTIAGSVERMRRVMDMLRSGASEKSSKPTELRFVVSAAVDRCSKSEPVPTLNLGGVDASVSADAEEFTMVLTHLIRNAQDACDQHCKIDVSLQRNGALATIVVADNGKGMSAEFVRDRLFRPFDSTKGNQGMGIGAYQAREFARKLGGDLQVESEEGRGTRISLCVPVD